VFYSKFENDMKGLSDMNCVRRDHKMNKKDGKYVYFKKCLECSESCKETLKNRRSNMGDLNQIKSKRDLLILS
jgi:hypothetical protein